MFIWKKEFELGIRSIDEQHKELLKIGNEINEMLQDKYQYPGTISHIKEHREFIDFIDDFEFNNLSDYKESLDQLLKKIINWVFNHIITSDFMYKDFLIKKGLS